ncbi:Uncharacterised protein [uncultured archaeon]|nr:Uncharacterised protein [uncultured archaeon]
MNSNSHELLLVAYDWILVVVGLVGHGCAILGWGYDLGVNYGAVLGELEVNLVAVNVDGLDSELVALFQLQGCAGSDGLLSVVINEDLLELLAGERVLIGGLLEEDVLGIVSGLDVAGEVLLSLEANYLVASPILELIVLGLSGGGIGDTVG